MSKIKQPELPWTSIAFTYVDVFAQSDGPILGTGIAYWDGNKLLKPDLISIFEGDTLPPGFYHLVPRGEPVLAILAKSVQ